MNLKAVIFTDGSSRGNPGPGGWGSVIVDNDKVTELGGGENPTTNNRMEIMAAIGALENVTVKSGITVHTDSSYLINGITKWIHGWKNNGWRTKTKQDVLNKDLWMKLYNAIQGKKITWKYVGGHVGIVGNERCDHIATAFADSTKTKLYKGPFAGYDLPNILDISSDDSKLKAKKSDSSRSRAKAYSYISAIGGVIEVHHSWAECERRVKGKKGARYKKSISAEDEEEIIKEFGSF